MSEKKIQHDLKTWPEFFQAVKRGDKTFEVRVNDREYKVGDILNLQEWDPDFLPGIGCYTGDEIKLDVLYILDGGQFGIDKGTVVMAIKPI